MSRSGDGASLSPTAWTDSYRELHARPTESLDPQDLERLAVAYYLIGDDERCAASWEAAHRRHADAGDQREAARCSFWLAFSLMMRGQMAQAGGWLGRTEAMLGECEACRASGYVLIPKLLRSIDAGDASTAQALAMQAAEIAREFADPDLAAFACLGEGQALIALGRLSDGIKRLDEVMLAVSTGDVGPVVSGIAYCAVILECMQVFDLQRAAEWTKALSTWCDEQPELVPYRGQCLVHRSQLQQADGSWQEAVTTIASACRRLSEPPHPALGLAHYQEAELHRLIGDFDEAAAAYSRASARGHDTMPGLALLARDRGDLEAAASGIRRALDETTQRAQRPTLLAAAADILRAAGDVAGARAAADELTETADQQASPVLQAMASQASGSVTLSEGDPAAALSMLRRARSAWTGLHMPYEAARTAVLIGLGCAALGDRASAKVELENARVAFETLHAQPDLSRLQSLRARAGLGAPTVDQSDASDLSARELEVLAHVARGQTNREIAAALTISQHTVGRHLENIFTKLGVSGRAAATAYAYEHHLL